MTRENNVRGILARFLHKIKVIQEVLIMRVVFDAPLFSRLHGKTGAFVLVTRSCKPAAVQGICTALAFVPNHRPPSHGRE